MDLVEQFFVAQDGFGKVVAEVPAHRWDASSPCAAWTVRDIVGHVLWGRHRLSAWVTGADYPETAGEPGAPNPGVLCAGDPAREWRVAFEATAPGLTRDGLARAMSIDDAGGVPLTTLLPAFVSDALVHTWDIAQAVDLTVTLDPAVVKATGEWVRSIPLQRPEFFGPELTPPADADETTRLLAFLGRAA